MQKEQTASTDAQNPSPQALPPGHNCGTVHYWSFPLKGQEDTRQEETMWFVYFLEPTNCPLFTSQDQESGFVAGRYQGSGESNKIQMWHLKKKTKIQATNQVGAGDHHRLTAQPLTYREQGQDLAGVPCAINLVVSVYAPGNICLSAKPTCMHGWQAVLRRPGLEELGKCIHFHFASICMPIPRPGLLFGKKGINASEQGCFQTCFPT